MASKIFTDSIVDFHLFMTRIKCQVSADVYKEMTEKWNKLRNTLIDLKECPAHSLDLSYFIKPKHCAWFDRSCNLDACKNIRQKE